MRSETTLGKTTQIFPGVGVGVGGSPLSPPSLLARHTIRTPLYVRAAMGRKALGQAEGEKGAAALMISCPPPNKTLKPCKI
jgi:hypothetical protein